MIPLRDANPTRRTSVVTIGIVIACFVVFAWELGLLASGGEAALDAFVTRWGVVPAELTAAWGRGDFLSVETATLITSQFLHAGWLHLLGNMLYLWIFANNVEDRLGRLGFLVFYLRAAWPPGSPRSRSHPNSTIPTIGASGAIAATLGAYLVFFPRARITSLVFLGFFYQLIDVPGGHRAGVLVRAPADRRPDLDRDGRDERRRGVLRPHRRVRRGRRGGTRPGGLPAAARAGRRPRPPWDNRSMPETDSSRWSSRACGSTCCRAGTW